MSTASSSPSNQTLALMTVSVAATVGILYYLYSNRNKEKSAADLRFHGDHKGRAMAPSSSQTPPQGPTSPTGATTTSDAGAVSGNTSHHLLADKTPKITNTKSAEKDLHLRIEELDKRGKALFKSGQVRPFVRT
jgi:hypothetical protein